MAQNFVVPQPTNRIEFRIWTSDDINNAIALWGDEKVTNLIGGPFTRERIQQRFEVELDELSKSGLQYWAMYHRQTGEFIGCCGIHSVYTAIPGDIELGYHLCAKFWGQGIASEAATAVLNHAFNTLKFTKIFSGHHPNNKASQAIILNKMKMTPNGDVFYPPTGLRHPVYYITIDDYNNIPLEASNSSK